MTRYSRTCFSGSRLESLSLFTNVVVFATKAEEEKTAREWLPIMPIIINLTWVRNHRQQRVTTSSCFVLFLFKFPTSGETEGPPTKLSEPLARNSFSSTDFLVVLISRKAIPCHVRVIIISLFYYFSGRNVIKKENKFETCYSCASIWSGLRRLVAHSINSSPHHWWLLIDDFVLLLVRSEVSKSNIVQTSNKGGRSLHASST